MPSGGGAAGSTLLANTREEPAKFLPKSLQGRRKKIIEAEIRRGKEKQSRVLLPELRKAFDDLGLAYAPGGTEFVKAQERAMEEHGMKAGKRKHTRKRRVHKRKHTRRRR